VFGGVSARQARIELTPSASRPPWMRWLMIGPSVGSLEAPATATMSPIDSAVETKKQIMIGRRYSGAKPSLKPGADEVPTQRKETGDSVDVSVPNMPVTSFWVYVSPAKVTSGNSAPEAIAYERRNEIAMLHDFMNGEPKMAIRMKRRIESAP